MIRSLKTLVVVVLILTGLASVSAQAGPPMLLRTLVTAQGTRAYRVHVPVGLDPSQPAPLVLAFHGGGGNARQFADSNGLWRTADRHGFLLVYPEGTPARPNLPYRFQTWNAGDCCGRAQTLGVDDVAFTDALLDAVAAEWSVDQNRIYATGFSNGGMMSYRLGIELGDRLAAIAPVGAALQVVGRPGRPMPLLAIHGELDLNVPWAGGLGSGPSGTVFRSQQDSVAPFLAVNRATPPAAPTRVNGQAFYFEGPSAQTGASVGYWWLADQGHTWPGYPAATNPSEPFNTDIDVNEEIWSFFAAHPREATTEALALGCGLALPRLESDAPLIGRAIGFRLVGGAPAAVGRLLAEPAGSATSLANGCLAWVGANATELASVTVDAAGAWTGSFTLPDAPAFRGTRWHLQVLFPARPEAPSQAIAVTLAY